MNIKIKTLVSDFKNMIQIGVFQNERELSLRLESEIKNRLDIKLSSIYYLHSTWMPILSQDLNSYLRNKELESFENRIIKNPLGEEIEIIEPTVFEVCGECGSGEVIECNFEIKQVCSCCGEIIMPCSLCSDSDCSKCRKIF